MKFDVDFYPFLSLSLSLSLSLDHISLDSNSSILSFTYSNIDSCVDRFLTDWERVFMMANLSRQGKGWGNGGVCVTSTDGLVVFV
jgi:hypothetical protein